MALCSERFGGFIDEVQILQKGETSNETTIGPRHLFERSHPRTKNVHSGVVAIQVVNILPFEQTSLKLGHGRQQPRQLVEFCILSARHPKPTAEQLQTRILRVIWLEKV